MQYILSSSILSYPIDVSMVQQLAIYPLIGVVYLNLFTKNSCVVGWLRSPTCCAEGLGFESQDFAK